MSKNTDIEIPPFKIECEGCEEEITSVANPLLRGNDETLRELQTRTYILMLAKFVDIHCQSSHQCVSWDDWLACDVNIDRQREDKIIFSWLNIEYGRYRTQNRWDGKEIGQDRIDFRPGNPVPTGCRRHLMTYDELSRRVEDMVKSRQENIKFWSNRHTNHHVPKKDPSPRHPHPRYSLLGVVNLEERKEDENDD